MIAGSATSGPDRLRLLRLGRGAGYFAALRSGSDAVADVLACVLDDPRWDRQIDERESYYAGLLITLGGDLSPLRERLLDDDNGPEDRDLWLLIGVLAEMARRRSEQAGDILIEAIAGGRRWRACLDALEAAGGPELIGAKVTPAVISKLVQKVPADDLADAARVVAAPWDTWAAAVPALRFVIDGSSTRSDPPRPASGPLGWVAPRIQTPDPPSLDPSMSSAELMARATSPRMCPPIVKMLDARRDDETTALLFELAQAESPDQFWTAMVLLGLRHCPDFMDEAEAFLRAESQQPNALNTPARRRIGYLRYLEELPPETTLPRARKWFGENWPLQVAGHAILARHATTADRTMLEDAGTAALTDGDMYALTSVIEGLTTIGARESLPFFAAAYRQVPYSYARRLVVKALLPYASAPMVQELLVEALWDCERKSRELSCTGADKSDLPGRRRITELAADKYEDPAVRAAAREAMRATA